MPKPPGSKLAVAQELLRQGLENYKAGHFEAAIQSWQQTLKVYREVGNPRGEGQALGNLGIVYNDIGEYIKSVEHHQKALAIMRESSDQQGAGQVLVNLGNAYQSLGKYEDAITCYQQSLTIVDGLDDIKGQTVVLANLGAIHALLDKNQEAIKYHEKSLAIADAIGDTEGKGYIYNNLGSVYHVKGDLRQAMDYYNRALSIATEFENRRLEVEVRSNLGSAYEDQDEYDEAINQQKKAFALAESIGEHRLKAVTLNNWGHALFGIGKFTEAEKKLRLASSLLDALRPGLTDAEKVSMFDTQVLSYNLLQQILVAQEKFEEALEVAEQGRARAFVELLTRRVSPAVRAEQESLDLKPPTISQIREIASTHNATLVEYSIIPEDEFKVQGKLRGRAEALFIWVVQAAGKIDFRKVDFKGENISLTEFVGGTRESLGVRGRGAAPIEIDTSNQKQRLRRLHDYLIRPIADLLPATADKGIIFFPQDALFMVPFPALQQPSGKYLIDEHTVLTAPAIQVLALTRQQRDKVRKAGLKDMLVVGNPKPMPSIPSTLDEGAQQLSGLPGARKEAVEIAKLLNTRALIESRATKAEVVQRMATSRAIHLATHGILDGFQHKEVPGAVALAPSGKDNGFITAEEIMDMDLRAELVVLSACDTGRGTITGDGVVGLSRSLISAGVPSVIVSLWKVPDNPTAMLMTEFYRHWKKSTDKAQALRQAMLTTKEKHPDPKNWAAFTLIGEAR